MELQWIMSVRSLFAQIYGQEKGGKVCDVVIPAVMGDFRRTVLAAPAGSTVTEQYCTDDRRTGIVITGRHECRGQQDAAVITEIRVGGKKADLGSGPLIV